MTTPGQEGQALRVTSQPPEASFPPKWLQETSPAFATPEAMAAAIASRKAPSQPPEPPTATEALQAIKQAIATYKACRSGMPDYRRAVGLAAIATSQLQALADTLDLMGVTEP